MLTINARLHTQVSIQHIYNIHKWYIYLFIFFLYFLGWTIRLEGDSWRIYAPVNFESPRVDTINPRDSDSSFISHTGYYDNGVQVQGRSDI